MSRNEEFHGQVAQPEYRVITRDKNGNSLYLEPDVDAPQSFDYPGPREALDHVAKKGMAWRYDFDNGEFKRAKIDHHVIHHLADGMPIGSGERYPAGWQRGDVR